MNETTVSRFTQLWMLQHLLPSGWNSCADHGNNERQEEQEIQETFSQSKFD
jgi:hypothetical protein